MEVSVLSCTENPLDIVSISAGTCYGKPTISHKRVETCVFADHLSVIEHATISFKVDGISRACLAQLTRHRHASFCVESQRYNRYDLDGDEWYVMPPEVKKACPIEFDEHMTACAEAYKEALASGLRAEDARYLLPEAMKTNLVVTMNARNLFHLFSMRLDRSAQWEIRELVAEMKKQASLINDQWRRLIEMYGGK